MKGKWFFAIVLGVAVAVCLLGSGRADAQWSVSTADGKSTLNLGFLSQLQGEWLDNADASHTGQNLFFRRMRLMLGGKINDKLTFFFETDAPNLGKGQASGAKVDSTMFIQDFFLTYSFSNEFKIDGGMLLIPVSHNSQQGATSLMAIDYGNYSFSHSAPLDSKVGRDYGVQARGYLANNHFEYRAGIVQGNRGADARMPFRTYLRAVYYPFDADTGFFYTGTFLGKKKVLAIGASFDQQQNYQSYGGDVFLDFPVGSNSIAFQGDITRYDGGDTFKSLLKQDAILGELGFFVGGKWGPFAQYSKKAYKVSGQVDEEKTQLGFIWWGNGHKFNVKVGAGTIKKSGVKDRSQVVVQWQTLAW